MSLSVKYNDPNTELPRIANNFGASHFAPKRDKPVDAKLSRRERTGVAVSSAVGVAGAIALLAKTAKWKNFSLNPKKIRNTRIKDTYLYQAKFEEKEIITMAAGSILGGFTGGLIIDERSNNNKAEIKSKAGEAIIQFGNACVPILTVGLGARIGNKVENNILKSNPPKGAALRWFAKLPKIGLTLTGLAVGMVLGNKSANYLKKIILNSDEERNIKPVDMFMHWDDLCVAASFLSDGPIIQGFARLVPLAMLVAGYQVGCKGLDRKYIKPQNDGDISDKNNTQKTDKSVKDGIKQEYLEKDSNNDKLTQKEETLIHSDAAEKQEKVLRPQS